jgi:hypothetical protein
LKSLYHVNNPPSDTYLRERLDEVNPDDLRPVFTKFFALAQRGKALEDFEFYEGHVLISGDGTGHFSSSTICCSQCCKKKSEQWQGDVLSPNVWCLHCAS